MQGIRIDNLINKQGVADYRGLNLDEFVPGSQLYPEGENLCYLITEQEELPESPDITLLAADEYQKIRDEYFAHLPKPMDMAAELASLKEENSTLTKRAEEAEANTLTALDAIASVFEQLLDVQTQLAALQKGGETRA